MTYSPAGASGVIADGGTTRCEAIRRMVERVGGSVESCYFGLGGRDLYVIGEVPDAVAAASLSIHTTAGGEARTEAITLLTPSEMDQACECPGTAKAEREIAEDALAWSRAR